MNPATFKSSKQADCYHDDTVAKGKEMKVLHALFTVAITALLAAGCATVPEPLAGEYPATTPDLADDSHVGQNVRWGGRIVEDRKSTDEARREILARPPDSRARPCES